ncbi:unnamed protein product [Somion occarium]|uniref:Uncharacterized protein n=1 Tax=Somion occarium TaxID=3059160 RepID=A0ABP1DMU7_9APHY
MSTTSTRVAIITGGAQGIGEAIALRLADEDINVVIFDVKGKESLLESLVKKIEAKGRKAFYVVGDVTNEADIKGAVDKTVETFGGLDIMVANAGILFMKPITECTPEDFNRVLGVNTLGVMLAFKHAAQQMIKQGRGGRIIGASSLSGKQGMADVSLYCASKFAVRGMTQATALELQKHNITVNSYAPGLILTPMVVHPDDDKHGGLGSVVLMNPALKPGTKGATPSVVAELVAYLIKPEAHFVTGQTITIDGGQYFD